MVEKTTTTVKEREYVIPLRKEWVKVSRYKRTAKSVKAIKEYVARHMRVEDRDLDKVKIDSYLNNEMWFRGSKKPFNKIKVKARKEGDIVRVELAEMPEFWKFHKAKQNKVHKKSEKKAEPKKEEKVTEKTEEELKAEKEKNEALATVTEKAQEKMAKAQKHSVGKEKDPGHHRMALKK